VSPFILLFGKSDAMNKRRSSPSNSECLETFVRSFVESSQMSLEEMLQLTSRLSGIPAQEFERSINSNPFRAEELTLSDLISEAVQATTTVKGK